MCLHLLLSPDNLSLLDNCSFCTALNCQLIRTDTVHDFHQVNVLYVRQMATQKLNFGDLTFKNPVNQVVSSI